jgi:hypothetical protein
LEFKIRRLPFPELNFKIAQLIPEEENTTKYSMLVNRKLAIPNDPSVPSNVNDLFFSKLLAMSYLEQCEADHEVIAYAVDLLSSDLYQKQRSTTKCMFHVWGLVAVSLSKLQFSSSIVEACLSCVEDAVEFTSEKLDAIFYRQQVAAHSNDEELEYSLFRELSENLPYCSLVPQVSLNVHAQFVLNTLENSLLECVTIDRILDQDDFENPRFLELKREKETQILKGKRDIACLRKLLHKNLGRYYIRCTDYTYSMLETLDLFRIAFERLEGGHESHENQRLNAVKFRIGKAYNSLQYMVKWICDEQNFDFDISDYRTAMQIEQQEKESQAHCVCPVSWGNVLFSHFILLQVFRPENGEEEFRMEQALAIYENFNHPRAEMIRQLKNARVNGPFRTFKDVKNAQRQETVRQFFSWNVFQLLRVDPDIRHLVRAGLNSVNHHDVTSYSF